MGDAADSAVGLATVFVEKPKEFQRLLRYLTSIERAYFRVLDKLTKLQMERRAEEQAAALERTWLASLAESEQQAEQQAVSNPPTAHQPAEIEARPDKLASFHKTATVPPQDLFR
jgi:septal ring factor EnvC (AmiA/AmiB activator)